MDSGDHVVVINAANIKVTSDKLTSSFSPYGHGLRQETLGELLGRGAGRK